ncbi:MAG: M28 family peptidase [Clostridia bacterium]|nr:M28 family peptidase [Clostridia bacterium]
MKKISGKNMISLLKKMDYVRLSATQGEADGAQAIRDELASFGLASVTESFKAPWYQINTVKFEVTEPFHKEYTVTGYGFSGNNAKDGLEAEFLYAEHCEDIDLAEAKGKIVLVSNGTGYELYERLCKAGVAGFIGISGNFDDAPSRTDLDQRMLRPLHIKHGQIPGVCLRMADAIDLVKRKPTKVKITLAQDEGEADSHNIIAEIPGTKKPEEVIVFTAHYDSVVFSHGMFDNASGSVMLVELARYFAAHPTARTLRFIWCGSEERGLLGSKAYVAAHEEELENIKLCINIDMAGPVIGRDTAIVTGEEKLCNFIEYMYKEMGHQMSVRQDIYSSDSIPFADKGVPGVNFVRFGANGAIVCHSRRDVLSSMNGDSLANTAEFVRVFVERMGNAFMFPVAKNVPDNIVEKIQKYLRKKAI